jgi:hypothetical protein
MHGARRVGLFAAALRAHRPTGPMETGRGWCELRCRRRRRRPLSTPARAAGPLVHTAGIRMLPDGIGCALDLFTDACNRAEIFGYSN